MFASFSSYLPSALQQVSLSTRPTNVLEPPSDIPPAAPVVDSPRKQERKEKEKHVNEAFIIVRPPPSKSAQPLSLQVQLVPPQSRNDRPLQALDASPDDFDTDLRRTQSNRSEASNSSGSVSSFASTSSASSGRRMIIPLYNLNVHAVMPTTILDAGTDAKVAKFQKRGLEVIGLAVFESIEVRPSAPTNGSLAPPSISARRSLDDALHEPGSVPVPSSRRPISTDRPYTSHAAISTSGDHPFKPAVNMPPSPLVPLPDQQPQRSTKKMFARIFKKKDVASSLSIAVTMPDESASPQSSPLRNSIRRSDEIPVSQPDAHHTHDSWSSALPSSTITSPTAVLGVHSTLHPPVSNPKSRPTKYIWVIRKWLKGTDTSILNGMKGRLSAGSHDTSIMSNMPEIEVRFEWCRGQKKGTSRKSRADKPMNSRERHSPTRLQTPSNTLSRSVGISAHNQRNSDMSHSSCSESATSLVSSGHRHREESDEESDPEDSETPWTCTVVVQRLGHSPQPHQNGTPDPIIRLKVATLAPTPHHPKVVGLLKMPFPLPDIELDGPIIRRRLVTAQGINKTTTPNTGELVLTAEEIKDTVSSTALWLVVREAFGGVGRERKKSKH